MLLVFMTSIVPQAKRADASCLKRSAHKAFGEKEKPGVWWEEKPGS